MKDESERKQVFPYGLHSEISQIEINLKIRRASKEYTRVHYIALHFKNNLKHHPSLLK